MANDFSKLQPTRRMDGFLAFINEHRLFTPDNRILVAVSGGIDSVVLTDLLHRHGYVIGVAHVNFGLRGADSDADAAFVENVARRYGVPFHSVRYDTLAEAEQRGESVQVTARSLRYAWFEQVRSQHDYAVIATAHHLNDVLETVLLNLTRGTGLAGLTGIPVKSERGVVRPLWFASREQIKGYASEQQLAWREDASNALDKYARNRLRHHVVPVLTDINPGLLSQLPQTVAYLRAAHKLLVQTVEKTWLEATRTDSTGTGIDTQVLRSSPEPLFLLGEWLRPFGFVADALAQFWQSVDQPDPQRVKNGQRIDSATHQLIHDRGTLWLLPREAIRDEKEVQSVVVPEWPDVPVALGTLAWQAAGPFGYVDVQLFNRAKWDGVLTNPPSVVLFDADQVPLPWTFRPWRLRDRIGTLGLKGNQLVSDLLTNDKVPAPHRPHVWVLESGGRIAWVLGLRMAHDCRVTDATQRFAKLTLVR